MTKIFSGIAAVLRAIFLKAKAEAEIVAPEVQKQISAILAEANSKVATIKSSSSVAALRKLAEDDIAAVNQTAAHHVSLIKAKLEADLKNASAILPSVASVLSGGVDPTPTGSTGPSGA